MRKPYRPHRSGFSFQRKQAVPRGRCATIDRLVEVLTAKLNRSPTDHEIASILAVSIESVTRLRASKRGGAA
jgi:DNA-directed RNA polymerase specialized sigma subunit